MLVTIPFGLWIFSIVADLVHALGWGGPVWADVAFYTIGGGIAGALLAAVPGLIDLRSITEPKVRRVGTMHMTVNLIVVALFVVSFALRAVAGWGGLAVAVSGLGVLLVCFSGWLGGEMIYHHGVGVARERRPGASESTTRRVA
jgi:uncharacterized membrane protein